MKRGEFIDLHWEEDVEAFHVRGHVSAKEFWAAVERGKDYTRAEILAEQELVRFERGGDGDGTVVMGAQLGADLVTGRTFLMPEEIHRGHAVYRVKDWTPVLHAWGRWSMENSEYDGKQMILRLHEAPGRGRFPITFIAWDRSARFPGSNPSWWAAARRAPESTK